MRSSAPSSPAWRAAAENPFVKKYFLRQLEFSARLSPPFL
jgi:hypothetical protein